MSSKRVFKDFHHLLLVILCIYLHHSFFSIILNLFFSSFFPRALFRTCFLFDRSLNWRSNSDFCWGKMLWNFWIEFWSSWSLVIDVEITISYKFPFIWIEGDSSGSFGVEEFFKLQYFSVKIKNKIKLMN